MLALTSKTVKSNQGDPATCKKCEQPTECKKFPGKQASMLWKHYESEFIQVCMLKTKSMLGTDKTSELLVGNG